MERMTAAYSLEMERKNKLSRTLKPRMVKVAAVGEENSDYGEETCTHEPKK